MKATQPIKSKRQLRDLAAFFLKNGEIRNYVLVVLAVHTALRIGDLLRISWDDVFDFRQGCVRDSFSLTEMKTGKSKSVLINRAAANALSLFSHSALPGRMLFISRKGSNRSISRQHAYRIISGAAKSLAFPFSVSCHSLRKTFGYLAWRANVPPIVIMRVYNHSSLLVTQRYLGITQDDIDDCYRLLADLT